MASSDQVLANSAASSLLNVMDKEYKDKEAETLAAIVEREAAVFAKDQDFMDQIQVPEDAAVAVCLDPLIGGDGKDIKVSSLLGDTSSPSKEFTDKIDKNTEILDTDVEPRPELTKLCEQMDSEGLLSLLMANWNNLDTICQELTVALECASEPTQLVLDSLEGFYRSDETANPVEKDAAALQGMRKSFVVLLSAMAAFLERIGLNADYFLNPETKQRAKAIADEWKLKLSSADNGNPLEAEAFLQLLASFRIASEFDEEELSKLVLAVAHLLRAPELCHSLGLTLKMPGHIESLINLGRQVDAVRYIHAFELTERFPPVPLLKSYLKEVRRNCQVKSRNASGACSQANANARELTAVKAVIGSVEEFGLEANYPLDPLHDRVFQLERSKSNKKRARDVSTHQQRKRSKADTRRAGDLGTHQKPKRSKSDKTRSGNEHHQPKRSKSDKKRSIGFDELQQPERSKSDKKRERDFDIQQQPKRSRGCRGGFRRKQSAAPIDCSRAAHEGETERYSQDAPIPCIYPAQNQQAVYQRLYGIYSLPATSNTSNSMAGGLLGPSPFWNSMAGGLLGPSPSGNSMAGGLLGPPPPHWPYM